MRNEQRALGSACRSPSRPPHSHPHTIPTPPHLVNGFYAHESGSSNSDLTRGGGTQSAHGTMGRQAGGRAGRQTCGRAGRQTCVRAGAHVRRPGRSQCGAESGGTHPSDVLERQVWRDRRSRAPIGPRPAGTSALRSTKRSPYGARPVPEPAAQVARGDGLRVSARGVSELGQGTRCWPGCDTHVHCG